MHIKLKKKKTEENKKNETLQFVIEKIDAHVCDSLQILLFQL